VTARPERWWSPLVLAVTVPFTPAAIGVYLVAAFVAPRWVYGLDYPLPTPSSAPAARMAPVVPLHPDWKAPSHDTDQHAA
jgi:hypothetical protein